MPGPLRDRISGELRLGRSPEAIRADLVAEGVAQAPMHRDHLPGALHGRPGGAPVGVSAQPPPAAPLPAGAKSPVAAPRAEHRRASRRGRRARGGGPLGGRSDHRRPQPVLDDLVDRTPKPLPDPDHHARRLRAEAVFAGLVEGLDAIPAHLRRSLTFDCGAEWANWRRLADHYDLQVWFCDPHSPWQRGQIENLNRQVRWWFPRGTDLRLVTVAQAEHAADILNHQRRRSLNHQSPAELYADLTAH